MVGTVALLRRLIEGALDDSTDSEVNYKLRTALQYFDVLEAEIAVEATAVREAVAEREELQTRLEELGYLEE
jgi:regulator of RNase E activity RraB